MNTTVKNLLSVAVLAFAVLFTTVDATAQTSKEKAKLEKIAAKKKAKAAKLAAKKAKAEAKAKAKAKKAKGKVKEVVETRKVMQTEKSTVCDVFTVENPNEADISQMFADMNLRRQAGDFGPGDYSAYDYWQKVYAIAPGFDIRVYTDGSAIYREMAAKAKEEGDNAKFEEYGKKSLELLDLGEKCYPQHAGKFDPSRAYIFELLYPENHEKILELYTSNLNNDTDPYSLTSIARYAMYMGYIEKMSYDETIALMDRVKAVTTFHKGKANYDYSAGQIGAIEEQYAGWIEEMEMKKKAQ